MFPNIPVPTDNIYKFYAISGVVLALLSIVSLVYVYSAMLREGDINFVELITLELDAGNNADNVKNTQLEFKKKFFEIKFKNLSAAKTLLLSTSVLGMSVAAYGFVCWHSRVQVRDNDIAELQREKLKCEIEKIKLDSEKTKLELSRLTGGPVDESGPPPA